MKLAVLGSGSKGNAAIMQHGEDVLLIDAGLSAKQIEMRMKMLGVQLSQLTGLILTHEHGDHTCGLKVLSKKLTIPIHCTPATAKVVQEKDVSAVFRTFEAGQSFQLGAFTIQSFAIQHDAVDPVAFVIQSDEVRWGMVSDVGHITQNLSQHLKGIDALFIEANYDERMLESDTKRPWSIKQRISSRHGHLSNTQVVELLKEIAHPHLKNLCLGHLSSDCNCPDLVTKTLMQTLVEMGYHSVAISCAGADVPHGWLEI